MYIELLQLLKDYDPLLNDHLETATVFKGTSSVIHYDLIDTIHEVMPDDISRQIHEEPCVG
jgi:hypothetical protein